MITSSEEETIQFGKDFAKRLKKGSIVALYGDLGAGKTTFVKGVVEGLSLVEGREVQSPTFTYVHSYSDFLHHFDLYRLRDAENFLELGLIDLFGEDTICLIEWPERIQGLLPKEVMEVKIHHLEEGKREIVYTG